jgi:hypothetical protein
MIPALLVLGLVADTLRVTTASTAPVFDGRATAGEWGSPSCLIQRPGGVSSLARPVGGKCVPRCGNRGLDLLLGG